MHPINAKKTRLWLDRDLPSMKTVPLFFTLNADLWLYSIRKITLIYFAKLHFFQILEHCTYLLFMDILDDVSQHGKSKKYYIQKPFAHLVKKNFLWSNPVLVLNFGSKSCMKILIWHLSSTFELTIEMSKSK